MLRRLRIVSGLAFLLIGGGALWLVVDRRVAGGTFATQSVPRLWSYWTGARQSIELELPAGTTLAASDPVFVRQADGAWTSVGAVRAAPAGGPATVILFPHGPPLASDARLTLQSTPDSLDWAIETLLPPERRERVASRLREAWQANRDDVLAALEPVVERSLVAVLAEAETELPASLGRHREEWQALGQRLEKEIVEAELEPLAREEIWPILRENAQPALNEVGREAFARLPLWRFGWRMMYDRSVRPDERLVDKEWQRFVDQELQPILQEHADDFVDVVRQTLSDAAANERVRETLRRATRTLVEDEEFRRLATLTAREVLVDNPRLREALAAEWSGPEARAALELAIDRMEPALRQASDEIVGTREGGFTPEFSSVLRSQILGKDRRWLLLEPGAAGGEPPERLALEVGGPTRDGPFLPMRGEAQP
jgi:hypothetical protein